MISLQLLRQSAGSLALWCGTRRTWVGKSGMKRDPGATGRRNATHSRCLPVPLMCAALLLGGCGGGSHHNATAPPAAVTCTGANCSFATSAGTVTLVASQGTIGNAQIVSVPVGAPNGITTPFGWFSFSVTGLTPGATITLTFTAPTGTMLTGYEKCNNGSCSPLPGATITGNVLTITETDGGQGDADGVANGTITDPVTLCTQGCVASSSGATAFWLPYVESPLSGGIGGTNGIGVVLSDLSSSTLQQVPGVFSGSVTPIAELVQLNFPASSTTLASYYPAAAVYQAADMATPPMTHLYGLPLDTTTSVPAPVQLGSLSEPAAALCFGSTHTGYANVLTPSSAFFIVQYGIAPTNSCGSGTTATVLINYGDPPSTAPATLPFTSIVSGSSYAEIYSFPSGQLVAEVVLTAFGGDLNIYPAAAGGAPSFSSPLTPPVASGVQSVEHHPIFLNRSGQASSTVLFDKVIASGTSKLYRIDSAGATLVYTAAGTLEMTPTTGVNTPTVFDNTNIYFDDLVGAYPNFTYNYYAAPIAGGPAVQIGSVVAAQNVSYSLVDADGTNLILQSTELTTKPFTFGLYALPVNGSAPYTSLYSYQGAGLIALLDYGSDHLFVNEGSPSGTATTAISLVLSPSGSTPTTPALAAANNTSFVQWQPLLAGAPTNGTVLQFQNLPTDGSQGGAQLNVMNTASFAIMPASGTPYTPPAGNAVTLAPVSNTIYQGSQFTSGGSGVGLALDVSNNTLLTIAPPTNTGLTPFNANLPPNY